MLNILIVDDSKLARDKMVKIINTLNIECKSIVESSDGIEALEVFKKMHIDLLITDLEMPKMDGIKLITEIRKLNDIVNILVVSSIVNGQIKQILKSDKHLNFLKKPFNVNIIKDLLLKIEYKLTQVTISE